MIGLVYYVGYTLVFVLILGVNDEAIGKLAYYGCVGLGILTAFRLMNITGPGESKSPRKAKSPADDSRPA